MVTLVQCLSVLIANLPKLLVLFQEWEQARAGAELDKKVASEREAIKQAFKNRDAAALRRAFE